jgi:hypothetical protein
MPEVRQAVEEGRISMTNLVKAKRFFTHEEKSGKPYSIEDKRELLGALEGQSTRACDRKLAELSPSFVHAEKVRPISVGQTQISFVACAELMAELEKIKKLWAHKNPNYTYA